MSGNNLKDGIDESLPEEMRCLVLNSAVLFPQSTVTVQLRMPYNLALLEKISDPAELICIAHMSGEPDGEIHQDRISKIGVVGAIINRRHNAKDTVQVTLEGHDRVRVCRIRERDGLPVAEVEPVQENGFDPVRTKKLVQDCFVTVRRLIEKSATYPAEYINVFHLAQERPDRFADMVASVLHLSIHDRLRVLEALDVIDRLTLLKAILRDELVGETMAEELTQRARIGVQRHQRELFLRAQLQEIRKELAETDPSANEIARLEGEIDAAGMPDAIERRARAELDRLQLISTASAEYTGIRNYVDWLVSLPWSKTEARQIDMTNARAMMDKEFYGQKKAKQQLLEFVTMIQSARKGGLVPCLIGPTGSGKTRLARVVARVLGRKYISIDLGLLRSETTLKGNRRTFPGAMPGRFLRLLAEQGVANPVCTLEEVDLLSDADRPDLSGIILEAIDPVENAGFLDHYLGVPYDFSQVFFVATAATEDGVPEVLAERMEFIELQGYMEDEKREIVFHHLIPELLARHGLDQEAVSFTIGAVRKIIREYTLEAGLVGLKKNLEAIVRRVAASRAETQKSFTRVNVALVEKLLGTALFIPEMAESRPEVGVATGLAWTQAGGDLMMIEALRMHGSGTVTTTGYLGDVMKESIQAAHSYVRSRADWLGIAYGDFTKYDTHIHFPSGAIPKDGPSAGITVCLVLASVMSDRPIRNNIAFTGEVSLRGKVLPVGGLMEKVAAAHRAGISRIVLPKQNAKDLKDIPRSIAKDMTFIPVERIDEVFEVALMDFDPSQQSLESLLRKELEKALAAEQKMKKPRKRQMTSSRSAAKTSRKKKTPRKK